MNLLINTSNISIRVWVTTEKTHPKFISRSFSSNSYYFSHINDLTINIKYTKIIKRSMISGKSPLAARMAFYALNSLTKKSILDNTTKNDQEALVKESVVYALDNSKGTPQQKEALYSQISSKRFPSSHFYNPYKEFTNNVNISWDDNTTQDFRILKELPVLSKFIEHGGSDISEVYCNNDDKSYDFPYQNQPNPDYIVTIKTKNEAQKLIEYKKYPYDEKGGQGMFKSSSRGTIGMLTYDENYQNIQTMSKPITLHDLFNHDKENLPMLLKAAENDKLPSDIPISLSELINTYKQINVQNSKDILDKRSFMQKYLWYNVQCHPKYTRSISYVFTDHPDYPVISEQELAFVLRFNSQLQDRMYNLDKMQDRRDYFQALLISYRDTVDPLIIQKLHHLHNNGLPLTIKLINDLAYIIKNNL